MIRQAAIYILFLFQFCFLKVRATSFPTLYINYKIQMDTVPVVKSGEVQPTEQPETVPVPEVIKQVPKSRKQMKPIAVPKIVTTKPKAIIKPKIVIKTGLIH